MPADTPPKFMINPMVNHDTVFVYHARKPRFVAKKTPEGWAIVDDIDSAGQTLAPGKLEGLLKRLDDWYRAFTTWKKSMPEA